MRKVVTGMNSQEARVYRILSINLGMLITHQEINKEIIPEMPESVSRTHQGRVIIRVREKLPPGYKVICRKSFGFIMEKIP